VTNCCGDRNWTWLSNVAVVHSSRHFHTQLYYTSDNRENGG